MMDTPNENDIKVNPYEPMQPGNGTEATQTGEFYSQQPRKKKPKGKGRWLAAIALCLLFSGALGFGGGYFALVSLQNNTASPEATKGTTVLFQAAQRSQNGKAGTVAEVAAQNAASVVEITTETVTSSSRLGQYVTTGAGSGVVLSADGYIVTNNHVIDGAGKITVRLYNGKEYSATLRGTDKQTDIAVLKIDASGLTPAVLGDSTLLTVGETAVAIGNPLGELGGTVTEGIISALAREVTIDGETMTLLQTSAAINPGNSGGGLFNTYGELVGIVNAKSSGTGIEGLGFAIPINTAKPIITQLLEQGYVSGRVDTGFTVIDLTSQEDALRYRVNVLGIYILEADKDSAFQAGDLIYTLDGSAIASLADYNSVLHAHKVGDTLPITVVRDRREVNLTLTLTEYKP